jgi:hypothetical protein
MPHRPTGLRAVTSLLAYYWYRTPMPDCSVAEMTTAVARVPRKSRVLMSRVQRSATYYRTPLLAAFTHRYIGSSPSITAAN